MLVLDAAAVRAALPMPAAIEAVRDVMAALDRGEVHQPVRSAVQAPWMAGTLLLKPAARAGDTPGLAVKVIGVFDDNPAKGLPAITGVVLLMDPASGAPLALLDGAEVTAIRTAAASAVATDLLARQDARHLALLGAGVQARSHLEAISRVRDLDSARVWSRDPASAAALVAWAGDRGFPVQAIGTAREAVDGADIICTVTASPTPVLLGRWVAPGAHVNAVGAFRPTTREVDGEVMRRAGTIVTDSIESARAESGDIGLAIAEGAIPADVGIVELGSLLRGRPPEPAPRPTATHPTATQEGDGPGDLRIYVSLGLAAQDLAAAAAAVDRARTAGLGVEVGI